MAGCDGSGTGTFAALQRRSSSNKRRRGWSLSRRRLTKYPSAKSAHLTSPRLPFSVGTQACGFYTQRWSGALTPSASLRSSPLKLGVVCSDNEAGFLTPRTWTRHVGIARPNPLHADPVASRMPRPAPSGPVHPDPVASRMPRPTPSGPVHPDPVASRMPRPAPSGP
eukprot:1189241-Prorocentrum_minimum.AAC.6